MSDVSWMSAYSTPFAQTRTVATHALATPGLKATAPHAPTSMNDGTFLGQGRNPGVLVGESPSLPNTSIETVFCSPARRCIETVKSMNLQSKITTDERLSEINYGAAEGLTFNELKDRHPEIIQEWSKNGDPNFPDGGESTSDVLDRLQYFINELEGNKSKSILVVTHNVVMRCLIGKAHNIPMKNWHHLNIPHSEPLEFKFIDQRIYPNVPRKILRTIFKKLLKI